MDKNKDKNKDKNIIAERKFIFLFIAVLAIFIALVLLQPSPQGAALGNLDAADKLLEKVTVSEPGKLESASKELKKLRLSGADQAQLNAALTAIDEAEISLEGDRARLSGVSSEIKNQIAQAKKNVATPDVFERIKGAKDQIFTLLWLVLIVILLWSMLRSEAAINFFKGLGVSRIKTPGGVELEFATQVKSSLEDVLRDYRQQAVKKYDGLALQYQIAETLDRIVKGPIKNFFQSIGKQPNFRCTVHVRDILFDNSIYQLTDYVGRDKGGRGRAWSVRRGMIGRTWRLEESYAKGTVPIKSRELIETWGLSQNETEGATAIQTMLCYLVKGKNDIPLAMIYLDAKEADAFGTQDQMDELLAVIEKESQQRGLTENFGKIWEQIQASAPLIEIYADRK